MWADAACKAVFWPTPGLQGGNMYWPWAPTGTCVCVCVCVGGGVMSASAVPQHGGVEREVSDSVMIGVAVQSDGGHCHRHSTLHSFLLPTRCGLPRTQKWRPPPPHAWWESRANKASPGLGQSIALHTAPALRTCMYLISALPIYSTVFFKTSPSLTSGLEIMNQNCTCGSSTICDPNPRNESHGYFMRF